ncbi:MAG: oligopeptide/dipeptide transporter, ATPase subunit [Pseudonocardiales bacterium]|nr:oligopeptide/dipeptide transporter, ATPase subunit [Pseudonocardiales bacterium]
MTATTGLQVTDLHTTFGSKSRAVHAVRGVTLHVGAGETFVLLGESGSGKSVTARSILRLYGDTAHLGGRVTLGDTELTALSPKAMRSVRGRCIGLVPQDPTAALDPLRTIGSQLVEVLQVHGMQRSKLDARGRARELLELVGIPDPPRVFAARPHELSGGMRQRAVIALAVACEPELLIADEPTTALDVTVQALVLELFLDLQRRTGMALLLVTHDVGVAEELGGRIGVMYAGRLVETGATREVLAEPRHPYTRGLLDSLPRPGIPRGELPVIGGRPPMTGEVEAGCAFAPRCPRAVSSCRETAPELADLGAGRAAACPVVNPVPALTSAVSA